MYLTSLRKLSKMYNSKYNIVFNEDEPVYAICLYTYRRFTVIKAS